jgi:hypothetical protein
VACSGTSLTLERTQLLENNSSPSSCIKCVVFVYYRYLKEILLLGVKFLDMAKSLLSLVIV